jgi:hypothetical protein
VKKIRSLGPEGKLMATTARRRTKRSSPHATFAGVIEAYLSPCAKPKFMIPGLRIRDLQRKFHSPHLREAHAQDRQGARGHHAALGSAACKIGRDPGSRMPTKCVPALLAQKRCSKSTRTRRMTAASCSLAARWTARSGSNRREAPYEASALTTRPWGR